MDKSTTNIKEAKARLSELIERARAGESVKISRRARWWRKSVPALKRASPWT